MTTPQKAFLTAGIIVQSLLLVDLVGMEEKQESFEDKQYVTNAYRYKPKFVGRSPVGILSSGGMYDGPRDLKKDVEERFWWYSGFNVGVTLVMLVIWRRKKTADA
jgi:hypothetical protein